MRDEPYEKMLRDSRIFPIFEGANDVMRAFIALSGIRPLSEELKALDELSLSNRVESLGVLAGYVGSRIKRELRPDSVTKAHPELSSLADPIGDQVKQLREVVREALREHKEGFIAKQFVQKRLADAVSDIYAQIAVLSRVTSIFEDQGVEPSARSGTSPRRSARAPRAGCGRTWIRWSRTTTSGWPRSRSSPTSEGSTDMRCLTEPVLVGPGVRARRPQDPIRHRRRPGRARAACSAGACADAGPRSRQPGPGPQI